MVVGVLFSAAADYIVATAQIVFNVGAIATAVGLISRTVVARTGPR